MKLTLIVVLFLGSFFYANAQTSDNLPSTKLLSLSNIEFTIYPNPADSEFQVEFLLPRKQQMEIYLISLTGDKIKDLLVSQKVEAGVQKYNFSFPTASPYGTYFLVIKSHGKSIIKKLEHQPRI